MVQRKTYLDLLRIIACIMVIMEHVFTGYGEFREYRILWVLYFCGKIAVPLFILISGAVLLPKQDSYKRVFQRVLRMVLVVLTFSLLLYGVSCIRTGTPFNIGKFYYLAYNTRATGSYWFLYAYIGILLMLPLLQKMVKNFGKADFLHMIFWTVLVLGLSPIVERWDARLQYSEFLEWPIIGTYVGLLVAGYYLDAFTTESKGKVLLAWAGFILFTTASILLSLGEDDIWFYEKRTLFNITGAAMCFFYAVKGTVRYARMSEGMARLISACGRLTFCTYLLGELLQDLIVACWPRAPHTPPELLLVVAMVFACGMALSCGLTRVPGLKKIL